jgi:pilus assembly protein CpaE
VATNKVSIDILVLLIQADSADGGRIQAEIARDKNHPVRLQCVEQLATAFARIAGGGVDLILFDVSARTQESAIASLRRLLREAPGIPTMLVCGADNEGLALNAMRAGATDCVMKEEVGAGFSRALHSAVELARQAHRATVPEIGDRRANGQIIAVLGAKGGVGATTIALNIAGSLARRSTVILVEMHPAFGTLALYLRPHSLARNLSHLVNPDPGANGSTGASPPLWPCGTVPGLRVLFGPQTAAECREIDFEAAKAIAQSLAQAADFVVMDLPSSLSKANRAVLEQSSSTVLVAERDPICVQAAARMARAIESWYTGHAPSAVIVNRTSYACPMPLPEIHALLGCQVLGVIPPGADLCLTAQKACAPVVMLDPESFLAGSLNALAEILAPRAEASPKTLSRTRFRT